MRHFTKLLTIVFSLILLSCNKDKISIHIISKNSPRIEFGSDKLIESLENLGYKVSTQRELEINSTEKVIYIGEINDTAYTNFYTSEGIQPIELKNKEGFSIQSQGNKIYLTGFDASGVLYACLELVERINENGEIPSNINFTDHPEMVLRGTAIGQQKPALLPDRDVYEYPITPENFPWFYNKELWIKYLDLLVENRMNSLYMWNGHPFASLVKLDDYPYAVEVSDETFELNKEMFSFITNEADKRGIWVIQMFYNIIVSKPFAEHNNIETQRRSRPITPLIADYTQKSVAAFIKNYPNVGLMVCLGEAMNTIEDDIQWFTETIIPGVKNGLAELGNPEAPPIILRGHDTDAKRVMDKALPIYKNLYTTYKYNGEALTTYNPRADWIDNNLALSSLGSVHISNVHILANLEPFRYGSPDFIQKSTQAMHDIYKANGLHLYPQSSYWDWPYTADKTDSRLLQINRDWIWYETWARYAWNCRRERADEIVYWSNKFNDFYSSKKSGRDILTAYEESGEIAPKILRRFGITDGNRQTLLLGMFMSQLVNPEKWRIYESFVESNGPKGERLNEYALNEFLKVEHSGETPPQIVHEILKHGKAAKNAIDKAEPFVKENKEEFNRLKIDIYCYNAIAEFFANKVESAMLVLKYKYSGNLSDLENALPYLEKSVENYSELVNLTNNTYLYANSMQTKQRRIPADGTNGTNKTWEELLPQYKQELENFRNNLKRLKTLGKDSNILKQETLKPVQITLLTKNISFVPLKKGQKLYSDKEFAVQEIANELKELKFVQLNYADQINNGTHIEFKTDKAVKIIVGHFNGHSFSILAPPTLETDASANNQGQADIRIANALTADGLYPVNIYTYYFEPGQHSLELGKGIALILGIIDGNQEIITHDAGIGKNGENSVDWLFY